MKKSTITLIVIGALILVMFFSFKGTYNSFIKLEEGVNQSWAQVENVYQRRADLIPNLVEVVKGYAAHEKETLQGVVEARSKMGGQVNLGADALNDPQAFAKFQQMQGSLTSALQRLMVVVERYPDLKADKRFGELQAQLEGTENRIAVERRRFNEAVQNFNTTIRQFPSNLLAGMFGFQQKVYFKSDAGSENAPKVKF